MTQSGGPAIRRLTAAETPAALHGLSRLLVACVDAGASVSFMAPLPMPRAMQFWRQIAEDVASGARAVLIAETGGEIIGTVQLVLAQPDNQPHRADLAKMLVHPSARRRGIGANLLRAIEQVAQAEGKTLLVLDTVEHGAGDHLYPACGWTRAGAIPDYALMPYGGLCTTVLYYRHIPPR
jgi:GNAT superfamily N-acetyltransferase